MKQTIVSVIIFAGVACPALANDSTAELGAGGLILSRTDSIAMESEDLFISQDKVTVDYVFRNSSDKDVSTIVAFPMPAIESNPYSMPAIPDDADENFMDFSVTMDGKPVRPELQMRAEAVGLDVTEDLKANGVPISPLGDSVMAALEKVPDAVAADWLDRGIIIVDEYDDGSGMKKVRTPFWRLRSTFWWKAVFPAGRPVKVSHRYKPGVGGSAGLSFFYDGKFQGEDYAGYKTKYCMDSSFEKAVLAIARKAKDDFPPLTEARLAYVLTTGGNWALGSIGKFTLTIDKGKPDNLVSFCGSGVKKIGPTTFQIKADDYYPDRDLDILILTRFDPDAQEPEPQPAPPAAGGSAAGSSGNSGK